MHSLYRGATRNAYTHDGCSHTIRIYVPSQYENLIKTAKKFSPTFEVKSIKNYDILNFHGWWPQYFKKTAIDIEKKGEKFSISQYRHLVYKSELKGYVKASNFIDGLLSVIFKLNKTKEVLFPEDKIYQDKVAVNPKKIQDIKSQTIHPARISRIL